MSKLIEIIQEKALSYGKFILASGQESDYYIDLSKVLFHGNDLAYVADLIIEEMQKQKLPKRIVIGGPEMGAIPIVASVISLMAEEGWIVNSFFVRKESKPYGKKDLIEGNLQAGDRVLMIEDVTTTGNSLWKAIEKVQAKGCTVISAISVLDREQGAVELFKSKSIPFKSLVKVSEVL